jgi:hypothetical protein
MFRADVGVEIKLLTWWLTRLYPVLTVPLPKLFIP